MKGDEPPSTEERYHFSNYMGIAREVGKVLLMGDWRLESLFLGVCWECYCVYLSDIDVAIAFSELVNDDLHLKGRAFRTLYFLRISKVS